jgi:hypothetical protein
MSAAAIKRSVIGARGGAMPGIEGVLLARNRYGDRALCRNANTILWVSDFGPETDIESQFGERLLASLSTGAKFAAVGDCFSSIRAKSGQPGQPTTSQAMSQVGAAQHGTSCPKRRESFANRPRG